MARNYEELQARMDPASRADNARRVRDELQRMALGYSNRDVEFIEHREEPRTRIISDAE